MARFPPKNRKFENSKKCKPSTKTRKFENSKNANQARKLENSKIQKMQKTHEKSKIRKFENSKKKTKIQATGIHQQVRAFRWVGPGQNNLEPKIQPSISTHAWKSISSWKNNLSTRLNQALFLERTLLSDRTGTVTSNTHLHYLHLFALEPLIRKLILGFTGKPPKTVLQGKKNHLNLDIAFVSVHISLRVACPSFLPSFFLSSNLLHDAPGFVAGSVSEAFRSCMDCVVATCCSSCLCVCALMKYDSRI